MYNKVILIGNLGKDPEVRYTQNNDPIVSFSLATSESWYDRKEESNKTITEWHKIVILNPKISSIASQYLLKGSKVYIEGKIRTRSWVDQSDQKRSVTEIIVDYSGVLKLLSRKDDSGDMIDNSSSDAAINSVSSPVSEAIEFDDIPF